MRPESSDISYLWDMLDASMAIRQFLVDVVRDDVELSPDFLALMRS